MPPAALLAASIAAPIVGGAVGSIASGGSRGQAEEAQKAALAKMAGIHVPTIAEQQLALQKEAVQGTLTPQMQGIVQQAPSAIAGMSTDPRLKEAQMLSLADLAQQSHTGLSSTDRMALQEITRNAAGQAQGSSAAAMQNLAARGMAGGGAELAAKLAGAQGAANMGAQQGQSIASQAQQKALAANTNAGQLASGIRGQEIGQNMSSAQLQDAISRFNAANAQQVQGSNVQNANAAQAANLANAQNVANQNVGLTNQQEMANKALYQTQFNNQMQQATGEAGAQQGMANMYNQQAKDVSGAFSQAGQGVGAMGASVAGAAAKNPDWWSNLTGGNKAVAAASKPSSDSSYGADMAGLEAFR